MRLIICLTLSFIFLPLAKSQVEWVHNSRNNLLPTTFKRTLHDHNAILLAKKYDPYGFGGLEPHFIILDEMGNTTLDFVNISWGTGNLENLYDIIETPDSSIILPARGYVADDWNNAFEVFPWLRFDNYVDEPVFIGNSPTTYNSSGKALSDGSTVIFERNFSGIYRMDAAWNSQWSSFPNYKFLDLAVTSSDTLVWAAQEALVKMDNNGTIKMADSNFVFNKVMVTEWEGVLGSGSDTLFLLSPDFTPISFAEFGDESIVDFSVKGKKVAVLTNDFHVYLFTDSLLLETDFPISSDCDYQFISLGNEQISLAGIEQYGLGMPDGGSKAPFIKEVSLGGDDYGLSNDVGFSGVDMGNAYTIQDKGQIIGMCFTIPFLSPSKIMG